MALKFSLDLKSEQVILVKDGVEQKLELKEMTGKQRDQYLTSLSKHMQLDDKGKPTVTSFDGLQAALLCRCLFPEGKQESVSVEEIQNYPSSVQTDLFKAAQILNGLDKDEEDEGKNS